MRVLITRPLEDVRETEEQLKVRGHEAVTAPLLTINFHTGSPIDLSHIQAVLATSANGVRALSRRTDRRDVPLFAVGPQTAQAARDAGFTDVKSANGDSVALARAVASWASTAMGPLLHASGTQAEGKLAARLSELGFQVRTEFLYDVSAATSISDTILEEIAEGRIEAVLLFSPQSARVFADCITRAGLGAMAKKLIGICISQATATALTPLELREIRIATHPNQTALLDCLALGGKQ